MRFKIRTLSAAHDLSTLELEATDEQDARRQMAVLGLFVTRIAPVSDFSLPWAKASAKAPVRLILFSKELLALLEAGLSLVECIEALSEKEQSDALLSVLNRLLEGLRSGKRFSTVLSEQGTIFPPLYLSLVRSAEETSNMPEALHRFIDYQERLDAVRAKLVSAAIYPSILIVAGGSISLFLITYVVPRFADVYQGSGRELPVVTALMMSLGNFISANLWLLLAGLPVVAVVLLGAVRRFVKSGGLAKLLVLVPGLGERIRIYQLSRLYMTLGMLLAGGLPIVQALKTAHALVSPAMREDLSRAELDIQNGEEVSSSFDRHRLTTPISRRMLRIGEKTGQLGQMLSQSAAFYEGEISRWIDRFSRIFEPVLMAAIGLLVGAIVVLLYMPIFDLAGTL